MNTHEIMNKVTSKTGYIMMHAGKAERAIFGSPTNEGLIGGVGEDADSFTILAKYDELMGYITKDGYKVKSGQFYEEGTKEVLKPKKVTLIIKINGEFIEYTEGDDKSLELQIAMKQEDTKKEEEKETDKGKKKELAKREKDIEAKEKKVAKQEKKEADKEAKEEAKKAKEEEKEAKKEKETKKE